ncbi:MAG: gas vesicle protein [Chloroflexi bacterium]|nr:gas vesicle protein [Chloroflexota bacterium]
MHGAAIAQRAREALAEQTGLFPEKVVSVAKNEAGWHVSVDVIELRRVPDSADVLATYVMDLDQQGDVVAYHRAHRYLRGQVGNGDTA